MGKNREDLGALLEQMRNGTYQSPYTSANALTAEDDYGRSSSGDAFSRGMTGPGRVGSSQPSGRDVMVAETRSSVAPLDLDAELRSSPHPYTSENAIQAEDDETVVNPYRDEPSSVASEESSPRRSLEMAPRGSLMSRMRSRREARKARG